MANPQKLGEMLPQVLTNIRARCNCFRQANGLPLLCEFSETEEQPVETELQEVLAVTS